MLACIISFASTIWMFCICYFGTRKRHWNHKVFFFNNWTWSGGVISKSCLQVKHWISLISPGSAVGKWSSLRHILQLKSFELNHFTKPLLDSNPEPLSSRTNTQSFDRTRQIIELCSEYLSVWCIWQYVLAISRTRITVNPHSLITWKSRNSLLKTGAKPEV